MRRIRIRRFTEGGAREAEDWVAEEGLLILSFVPGGKRRFAITPEKIRAFVYGHLLGAGLIRNRDDVLSYREGLDPNVGVPGEVIRVEVALRVPPEAVSPEEIVWTACGGAVPEGNTELKRLSPRPLIPGRELLRIPRLAAERSADFRLTGAYHYAFLFDPGLELLAAAKDIGRHNAVDKVIGEAFLKGISPEEAILYTTGRITAEIALKALRAGIPLVASRGAPLLGAIVLARRYNLGLAGFLRGQRFNLYAGERWFS